MRHLLLFIFCAIVAAVTHSSAYAQSALRAGDTMEIRLSGVPADEVSAFNAVYTVDEKGMINLPYINLVKAEGLQANQLQRVIESQLKEAGIFVRPTIVINIQNNLRFVNVGGSVRNPMRIQYTTDLTLLSAVNAAGGFNDFANRKKVRLIRGGKSASFDCNELMKEPSKDPAVLPGDQIDVPASMW